MVTGEKKYVYNETRLRDDCATVTRNNETGRLEGDGCTYLFNVVQDETEQTNLYGSYPDMEAEMLSVFNQFVAEAVDYDIDSDKEDEADEVAAETGYWGPWLDGTGQVEQTREL